MVALDRLGRTTMWVAADGLHVLPRRRTLDTTLTLRRSICRRRGPRRRNACAVSCSLAEVLLDVEPSRLGCRQARSSQRCGRARLRRRTKLRVPIGIGPPGWWPSASMTGARRGKPGEQPGARVGGEVVDVGDATDTDQLERQQAQRVAGRGMMVVRLGSLLPGRSRAGPSRPARGLQAAVRPGSRIARAGWRSQPWKPRREDRR